MLTLTFGMTAPEESVTRPVIVEVPIWAKADTEVKHTAMIILIMGASVVV
jgi:hypothetical protein